MADLVAPSDDHILLRGDAVDQSRRYQGVGPEANHGDAIGKRFASSPDVLVGEVHRSPLARAIPSQEVKGPPPVFVGLQRCKGEAERFRLRKGTSCLFLQAGTVGVGGGRVSKVDREVQLRPLDGEARLEECLLDHNFARGP